MVFILDILDSESPLAASATRKSHRDLPGCPFPPSSLHLQPCSLCFFAGRVSQQQQQQQQQQQKSTAKHSDVDPLLLPLCDFLLVRPKQKKGSGKANLARSGCGAWTILFLDA